MVGNSFWKHKDSATLDRIWKLFCHHRIFFLPLLAQFLIVSHDIWCVRKRLYTCSFCRLNSSHSFRIRPPNLFDRKNLGDSARRIFLLSGNYFLPSLTHLWFVSPDFWCVESDCMCADTVHF